MQVLKRSEVEQKRRLGGGPLVCLWVDDWFDKQAVRISRLESATIRLKDLVMRIGIIFETGNETRSAKPIKFCGGTYYPAATVQSIKSEARRRGCLIPKLLTEIAEENWDLSLQGIKDRKRRLKASRKAKFKRLRAV
jgi:hypothetical protein